MRWWIGRLRGIGNASSCWYVVFGLWKDGLTIV
jgi:hypothetical protein